MFRKALAMILAVTMLASFLIFSAGAQERLAVPTGDAFVVKADVITDDFKTGDEIKVKLFISDIKEGLNLLEVYLKVDYNPSVLEPLTDSFTSSCEEINSNDPEVDWDMSVNTYPDDSFDISLEDGNFVKGVSESDILWVEIAFRVKADNTQLVSDEIAYTSIANGTESVEYATVDGTGTIIKVLLPSPAPTEEPTPEPTPGPSDEPSDEPTEEPTDEPSDEPTDEPNDEPSDQPTDEPSDEPSDESTDKPASSTPGGNSGTGKNPNAFDIGLMPLAAVVLSSCALVTRRKR